MERLRKKVTTNARWFLLTVSFQFACLHHFVSSNENDPHQFPSSGPFFEGWYTRIQCYNDSDLTLANRFTHTAGVVFGKILPKAASDNDAAAILAYGAILYTDSDGRLQHVDIAFDADAVQITVDGSTEFASPTLTGPARNWLWQVPGKFSYAIQAMLSTTIRASWSSVTFEAELGAPQPFLPDGEGPGEFTDAVPGMPLHWFIYSTNSPVQRLQVRNDTSNETLLYCTSGAAHQEKNWGGAFPTAWIWAQGVDLDDGSSFQLAGGPLGFGPFEKNMYLGGFRSPATDFEQHNVFLPMPLSLHFNKDGCTGELSIDFSSPNGHRLQITLDAAPPSFSTRYILGPTANGFEPFCEESFDATATVTAYKDFFTKIDTKVFRSAALEFGGEWSCLCQNHKDKSPGAGDSIAIARTKTEL